MIANVALGLLIPFIGTTLGAACVYFMRGEMKDTVRKSLLGFASGVMVSASLFSLLLPAIEDAEAAAAAGAAASDATAASASGASIASGAATAASAAPAASSILAAVPAYVPAAVGTALGMGFLLLLDHIIPHLHTGSDTPEGGLGHKNPASKSLLLCLAVTLHNIPEGMATGVVLAGAMSGKQEVTMAAALALSIGIAIQNFPEGAVISMPLASEGKSKLRAFALGTLSGAVEPVAGLITIFLTGFISSFLPYVLSFAAGAMLYVVVEELIPEASEGSHTNHCTIGFGLGFILMMVLDIALG